MPFCAAARSRASVTTDAGAGQSGFSLLELLVTLLIIALMTSFVGLSFNSGGQDVRVDAAVRNLADVASYAVDEAQMTAVNYGLLVEEEYADGATLYSYSWREYQQQDGWQEPASGKAIFASQSLPPGIALELELEDAPTFEPAAQDVADETDIPQVVFYASGEVSLGAINVRRIADGALLWRIEWDLLGRFKLLQRGDPPEDEEG